MQQAPAVDASRWIDEHGDALFAYALLHLGDREAAEERVQEALMAALEARSRFRGQSSQRTWLLAILRHKICDHVRRRRRETAGEFRVAEEGASESSFTSRGTWRTPPGRWTNDPSDAASRPEFWEMLRGCLDELPARGADAFCLRELQGLSTEAICKVLDVTATNLWTLLHRSRARLRRCLERRWFGSDQGDR